MAIEQMCAELVLELELELELELVGFLLLKYIAQLCNIKNAFGLPRNRMGRHCLYVSDKRQCSLRTRRYIKRLRYVMFSWNIYVYICFCLQSRNKVNIGSHIFLLAGWLASSQGSNEGGGEVGEGGNYV